jgi:hypothetical protein
VGANFRAFLKDDYAKFFVAGIVGELLQANCGTKASWAYP